MRGFLRIRLDSRGAFSRSLFTLVRLVGATSKSETSLAPIPHHRHRRLVCGLTYYFNSVARGDIVYGI